MPFYFYTVSFLENAAYAGTVRLGNGASHIDAGVYLSKQAWDSEPSDTDDATVHVLMNDDCTPVVFATEGKNPDQGDTIVAFVAGGYEPTVTDKSVFEVPTACKKKW